jgi:hypothetical protein
MAGSAFEPLPGELLARRATGYEARFLSDELSPAPIPPTVWAEGGLWSCVEDVSRWVSLQFREDAGPRSGEQVVAGTTLREMHTPRYLGDEGWTEAWCIAWYAIRKGDVVWATRRGSTGSTRASASTRGRRSGDRTGERPGDAPERWRSARSPAMPWSAPRRISGSGADA